jgi:hypothetical protein
MKKLKIDDNCLNLKGPTPYPPIPYLSISFIRDSDKTFDPSKLHSMNSLFIDDSGSLGSKS